MDLEYTKMKRQPCLVYRKKVTTKVSYRVVVNSGGDLEESSRSGL